MDDLLVDMVKNLIDVNRQLGSTSLLLGAMYSSPNAILVVGNLSQKHALGKSHRLLSDRILTVSQIKGGGHRGMRGPLLFDTTAIISLIKPEKEKVVPDNLSITKNSLSDALEQLVAYNKANFPNAADGYVLSTDFKTFTHEDGYVVKNDKQLNVKMTEEDLKDIQNINRDFFEGEATNSMLGRVLLRKGIQFYKRLKEKF